MDTIRMAFVLASMNNLDVCAADISTAFLYGKTKEKVYLIAGPEFGEHAGKHMIIEKGLYGLKSSSARFHEHLASKLRRMVSHQARLILTSGYVTKVTIMNMWQHMLMTFWPFPGIPCLSLKKSANITC